MAPASSAGQPFESIFHRNKDRIYRYAVNFVGDRDAAEDIVQESFVRLYRSSRGGADIENPFGWLLTTVRNLSLNHIRDSEKNVRLDAIVDIPDASREDGSLLLMRLRRALAVLDVRHREALVLKEYLGMSYDQIADLMQLSLSAVRSLLFAARMQLRAKFQETALRR